MRRFRAIVQSVKEPLDKEVIWCNDGELLYYEGGWVPVVDANLLGYESDEDPSIKTVKDAIDKLLYIKPEIVEFAVDIPLINEKGTEIPFCISVWEYNKDTIKHQSIDGEDIDVNKRELFIEGPINSDTIFELKADDNAVTVSKSLEIKFVDFIYYGTSDNNDRYQLNPTENTLTVTANTGEYIWVFIPLTAKYKSLWFDNINVTSDFIADIGDFYTNTSYYSEGVLYTSKNHGLGEITLKLT